MLNGNRTDLRLLLECLKWQMKCPSSQKQALLTIVSICQQNSQNVEFLLEIGGVSFIYNLSRASDYSEVKETALFTLCSLAEVNESCKRGLCREEVFGGLVHCMEREASLTLKRVAVYTVCVLVSNNKQGQSLAMTSGCIDILLHLFRSVYPMTEGTDGLLQLWASVSAALCGCVNNPQNEENQRACMCVLPLVKVWLQQVSAVKVELAQPICSFISMTVANNSFVQEYFASLGGLLTLSHTLSSAVSQCRENPAACVLATMITRTLSACINNIEAVVSALSKLSLVPDLLLLLSSPNLSPWDQLAAVLTLGHCTDACVEHQCQLVQGGGLPLMISLLTDAKDEEVKKAATFVLQTCKQLTGSIAGQSGEPDLQRHRQDAWEIQQRIQQLDRPHMVEDLGKVIKLIYAQLTDCREEPAERIENVPPSFTPPTQPSPLTVNVLENQEPMRVERRLAEQSVNSFIKEKTDRQRLSAQQTGRKRIMKNGEMEEPGRETTEGNNGDRRVHDELGKEKPHSATQHRKAHSSNISKLPVPMKRRQQFGSEDELSVCSELLNSEIERILITPAASKNIRLRCTGCVSGADEVNSRSMAVLLRRCKSLCEFHRLLRRAEDGLKTSVCSREHERAHKPEIGHACTASARTDRHKQSDAVRYHMISLTPLKRSNETPGSDVDNRHANEKQKTMLGTRVHRDRKDYSGDELQYLGEGARRFGHSWNTILWSYPFQPGRTNVDLARKYRRLQRGIGTEPDLGTQECVHQRVEPPLTQNTAQQAEVPPSEKNVH